MAKSATKRKPTGSPKRSVSLRPKTKPRLSLVKRPNPVQLLVGTKKGAWILKGDDQRKTWAFSKPILFGCDINHFAADPNNGKIMMIAAKTGHLGPTVYRSVDGGKNFKEAKTPPAFSKTKDADAQAVDRVFCVVAGHKSEPGVWYAGTAPAGLFRSDDYGDTWQPVKGFNDNKMYKEWTKEGGTPDGQFLHSVCIDPRDANHMYLGISIGGVFESKDKGQSWEPLNRGVVADFLPDQSAAYGHDPHWVIQHPKNPDRLYQQNHCGIYRLDRPSETWERIGLKMPKSIGDFGFPIISHPENPDIAWVFPMDGSSVWPRTAPDGKPAVFKTINAGKTWSRQDKGFPADKAWWTVYRQGLTHDYHPNLGLYMGTSSGELWSSKNEGDSWSCIARHLPKIQSVTVSY